MKLPTALDRLLSFPGWGLSASASLRLLAPFTSDEVFRRMRLAQRSGREPARLLCYMLQRPRRPFWTHEEERRPKRVHRVSEPTTLKELLNEVLA